jgi:hypothetical protein
MHRKKEKLSIIKNKHGEVPTKETLIIGTITLIVAIIIVIIFIIIAGIKKPPASIDSELLNFIRDRESKIEDEQKQKEEQEAKKELESFAIIGVISSISGNTLTLIESETQENKTIIIFDNTTITYNGEPLSKSLLGPGDHAQVYAKKDGNDYLAEAITISISVSPEIPAPTPINPVIMPDGSLKPL